VKPRFETYKPRKIEFQQLVTTEDWNVKVYSITNKEEFNVSIIENVLSELPNWIALAKKSDLPVYDIAFLIIHEAREGFLIVFNWWTAGEMVETKVYFANFNTPGVINVYPYHPKSLLCIWELEIFAHERKAWIHNVLSQANDPKFKAYLADTLNS